METVIPILIALPHVISALIAVAGFGAATWQAIKRREITKALALSEDTLTGMVTLIELFPETDETKRLKAGIEQISEQMGTETKLHGVVKETEAFLRRQGILTTGDDTGQIVRAGKAAMLWREGRA